jgi:cytochrome c553
MKIALLAVLAFMLIGCGEESKTQTHEAQTHETQKVTTHEVKAQAVKEVVEKVAPKKEAKESITKTVEHTTEAVKSVATEAVESATKAVESATKTVTESATKVVESATKTVTESATKAVESATKAVEPVKKAVAEATSADGKTIFKACIGCHGASAEKPALGKSKVIKGWDAAKVEEALNGYKNGTYGGAMKALMKGQASKLSDNDIKAVAEYISKL